MSQRVKAMWVMTATYYREALDDATLQMYSADVADLPEEKVLESFIRYRRNPKNRRSPLPADLRALVAPDAIPEDLARQTAARIWGAVSRRGAYWELGYRENEQVYFEGGEKHWDTFQDALIAELGSVGAGVVQTLGGWSKVHLMLLKADAGVAMAQLRELSLSLSRLSGSTVTQLDPVAVARLSSMVSLTPLPSPS